MGENPINVEQLKSNFVGTIDKQKVAGAFTKDFAKAAKVDGSIFESVKGAEALKQGEIDMLRLKTIKPKSFFSGLKEKTAKAWNGIKNTFSNFASKFKTGSANSTGAGSKLANAKNYLKGMGGKIKNGLKAAPSKVGRFFKGKGGKWALVGLAIAAATAAGVGIYKAVKGKSETTSATDTNNPTQPKPQPTKNKPTEPKPAENDKPKDDTKPDDKTGAATGSKTGNASGADKTNKSEPKTDEETPEPKTVHKIVKGDNVWNIAKKHLEELNGKKPTNAEILKHTKELMEINGLEFEPDGKRVMIRPDEEIKLVA